jgi:serine/threonine-protein kinase RsbW
VLRTATASLASRLDFTLDDIEDLRIAVDEACALLLPHAVDGSSLECAFDLSPDALAVTVSVPTVEPVPIAQDSFAWTVLTALDGEVTSKETEDGVMLSLVKRRVSTT